MVKHILRASILSAVIVFSMALAFMQGMKVNCTDQVRIKNIKTTSQYKYPYIEVAGTTVCGTAIGAREQVDAVQPQAVVLAVAQWNALYQ